MNKLKIHDISIIAIFTALSAVLSQVVIPIGIVPINLTHISILTSVGILGLKKGTLSQICFVLLGAIGIPVFSGLRGGLSSILGPTGGFIIGYIACSFVSGILMEKLGKSAISLLFSMIAGMLATYIVGISWFMFITNLSFVNSLKICVIPFIFGDILKVVISLILVKRLYPLFNAMKINTF